MAKSKRWSMKDITVIKKFIKEATDAGHDEHTGIVNAAAHFGVTPNAVKIRYGRYLRNEDMGGLKKNTTKVPIVRKTRKYTKKQVVDVIIDDGGISRVKRKYTKRVLNFKEDKSPVAAAFAKRVVADSNKLVFSIGLLTVHVPKITAITVDFDTRSITYTY